LRSKRAAIIIIALTALVTGLFATRLWAQPNPLDHLPIPISEQS
jgi:hypothetical protein